MITRKVIAAVLTGFLLVGCGIDTSPGLPEETPNTPTNGSVTVQPIANSEFTPEETTLPKDVSMETPTPELSTVEPSEEPAQSAEPVGVSVPGETEEWLGGLVTDDKKIVINMNGLTNVFYHEGNNVTKLTQFRNYETNENAVEVFNQMVSARDSGEFFTDTDLENMRVVGKYVVWEVGEKFVSGSMGLNKDELPTVDEVNEFSKIFVKGE